jgi:hypothetical protein
MNIKRPLTRLEKQAERGYRGYPVATVAWYGPDASRASKVAVGIVRSQGENASELERWFSETEDVRYDEAIAEEIVKFIEKHGVKSVAIASSIIGCPHEEGPDYPEGEVCPMCPYWATRDRWTGEELPTQ